MTDADSGKLLSRDIELLRCYASAANRELYWNYLAELSGNDGYGRLALGVVKKDYMPGATANAYAHRPRASRSWRLRRCRRPSFAIP
jgi:hypothetical protein